MSYCTRCSSYDCSCSYRRYHHSLELPTTIRGSDLRAIGDIDSSGRVRDLLGQPTGYRAELRSLDGSRVVNNVFGQPVGRIDMMGIPGRLF